MSNNIKEYISSSLQKSKEHLLYNSIPVILQNSLVGEFSIKEILSVIESRIPQRFFQAVDVIYVGQFKSLQQREVEALYEDGAIFISNALETIEDYIESIGHEVAHAMETVYPLDIYADGELELEFIGKRKRLRDILTSHGYQYAEGSRGDFFKTEYDEGLDTFFYQDVGYPLLTTLTSGLFMSPYAVTSLREYFANGFEWYLIKGEKEKLKNISPVLYYKLDKIFYM